MSSSQDHIRVTSLDVRLFWDAVLGVVVLGVVVFGVVVLWERCALWLAVLGSFVVAISRE